MLLVAAAFLALHFIHLTADFPNHSIWSDWSKYTDEGWYGDAAIRHYQLGHWNLVGDFNPAAALPAWPALEMVLFRFTGVSLAAARALAVSVFGLSLTCCYWLIRRWSIAKSEPGPPSLAPALAVLLLAVNPMIFAFSRLAILEPLLILLALVALLVASIAGEAAAHAWSSDQTFRGRQNLRSTAWAVALGLLLPLLVLTKTTGLFLFPAILWVLWAASEYRLNPFLRAAGKASGVGGVAWGAYYGLFVQPHYLADYRYLFDSNTHTGVTRGTFWFEVQSTILDTRWMGETLFVLGMVAVIGSLAGLVLRRLRANPLPAAALIWILGYASFLAYHANLMPRYYLVLAFPLTMLTAIFFEPIVAGAFRPQSRTATRAGKTRTRHLGKSPRWMSAAAVAAALLFVVSSGADQTIHFVRHPEYTFVAAAQQIRQAVEREQSEDPAHSTLVLSISGAQLSLMVGLDSICDDFGTMELPQRVATYKPGWFATWNFVEDDKMDSLVPMYTLVRVTAIPALDDPERNLLILYRLDPVESEAGRGPPLGREQGPKPGQ
jgi:4-amino-4-deoxy-L-arabinose transferase-like glycosyltransferase